MLSPGKYKTVQPRSLAYAQETGWSLFLVMEPNSDAVVDCTEHWL